MPYLANSCITPHNFTGRPRKHRATFIGSLRSNHFRTRLQQLRNVSEVYVSIQAAKGKYAVEEAAQQYAREMMNSMFCLVIPGDTISSRRLFDAIVAGCIPVIVTGAQPGDGSNVRDPVAFRRSKTLASLPFSVSVLAWHTFTLNMRVSDGVACWQELVPYDKFCVFIDGGAWNTNTTVEIEKVLSTPRKQIQGTAQVFSDVYIEH